MKLSNHEVNAAKVRALIHSVLEGYRSECERSAPHVLKLEHRLSRGLDALCQEELSEEEQVIEHIKDKRYKREQSSSE